MQHNTGNVAGATGGPTQREGEHPFASSEYQLNHEVLIIHISVLQLAVNETESSKASNI
jgi:hypothetical protein